MLCGSSFIGEEETVTAFTMGSAQKGGPLWGARARDWAEIEDMQVPTYEEAIRQVGVTPGRRVLDIGCGSGVFLRLAADRGADASGLDASEALVEIARGRAPDADVRVGEMEALPWDDGWFDLVTGFNAFFFAADMIGAFREAGRVAKPGAPVVIQVWGRPERCELEATKRVARRYAPPPPPDAPPPPSLSEPGVLEQLAREAGLAPGRTFDITYTMDFGDDETAARLLTSPMGLGELAGPEREDGLRRELVDVIAPYRGADGRHRLVNEFHYLIATA